jgi:branched-chain amino acid transport system substrate-binding protein
MDSVGGPLLRQMKALGIKAKLMGGDGICTEALPKLSGGADDVVVCAEAGGVTPEQEKKLGEFAARFKKRYGYDVQIYAPYAYDATMAIAHAMADAKSTEPARYLPYLKKVRHDGISGIIAFDAKGDIKDGALTLFGYKADKKTRIEVIK